MSRGSGLDVVDALLIGGGLYVAWVLFHRGAAGIGAGANLISAGQGGPAGSMNLKPGELDELYNFRDILPGNVRGPTGSARLRDGAPAVLRGPNALGYGTEPADTAAAAAVARYAAARIAGALPA